MNCEICGSVNNVQNKTISYKWKGGNIAYRKSLCPQCFDKYKNGNIDLRHQYVINTEQLENEFKGSDIKLVFVPNNNELLCEGPKGKGVLTEEELSDNPIEDLIAVIKSKCL